MQTFLVTFVLSLYYVANPGTTSCLEIVENVWGCSGFLGRAQAVAERYQTGGAANGAEVWAGSCEPPPAAGERLLRSVCSGDGREHRSVLLPNRLFGEVAVVL